MVTIRPASSEDYAAVQSIYAQCISQAAWLPEDAKRSPVFADVSHGEVVHLAMTGTCAVVGFVSVQVAEPFIHHLYVRPEEQGTSVGKILLDSLQAWLPQPWRLKCVLQNVGGLRFYRRCGWEEVDLGESEHGPFVLMCFHQSLNRSLQPTQSSCAGRTAEFKRYTAQNNLRFPKE